MIFEAIWEWSGSLILEDSSRAEFMMLFERISEQHFWNSAWLLWGEGWVGFFGVIRENAIP